MKYTIHSRILDKTISFSRPGTGYVYADLSGKNPGTLGWQICDKGMLMGSTITFSGDDPVRFARLCRTWYRTWLKYERR